MPTSLVIARIALGGLILLAGRSLLWLLVTIAGFFFGTEAAGALCIDYPPWLVWMSALLAGLVGALLAALLQRVAFILGGFYGGGYLAMLLSGS